MAELTDRILLRLKLTGFEKLRSYAKNMDLGFPLPGGCGTTADLENWLDQYYLDAKPLWGGYFKCWKHAGETC